MALLAHILKANVDEFLLAAGYTEIRRVTSFDQPFPLEALSPDSFERFCFYLLAKLYPTASVNRVGGSGHSQEGVDIEVSLTDGTLHSFQCKRVDEFGPQKVRAAAKKHTRWADRKFLLLSRVASPQARQAIRKLPRWELWDKEDITRLIRNLPRDDQRRLVDIFFPGQRFALLGINEPGPWLTAEEFYLPFELEQAAFNHTWGLVGRSDEVKRLLEGLSDYKRALILLVGAGGIGKSRVLKRVIEEYESGHRDVLVRFLSPTDEITQKSLEDLGSQEKVIVVDDAHEREDLGLLFQFSSIPTNKAKLFLSLRPYGMEHIRAQAGVFALVGERVLDPVKLDTPSLDEATSLAAQVLERFGGPISLAKHIARQTRDCPLATVLGAQIVSIERLPLEFAENDDAFRYTLLGKFREIIAGNLGEKGDAEPIKKLLRILALVQPFNPDDRSLYEIAETIEQLDAPQTRRLIGLLTNGGLLFKRGGLYRLSPDVLADFIIEDICIVASSGESTGYAERVFDIAPDMYVKPLLLNLGKVDWIRTKGNTDGSQLLDGIWNKLKVSSEYGDPHIAAVTAVAYYQPSRALAFVDRLILEKQKAIGLSDVVKNAAYNLSHLKHACECLWELGKSDKREPHQHPNHAIRILSDLCAVDQRPLQFNEIVVEFGLSLLGDPDAWSHKFSPFDFLKGILRTEGDDPLWEGAKITFHPFTVNPDAVAALRNRVIDGTMKLLSHSNARVAILAAGFLKEGLKYPVGLFGTIVSEATHNKWSKEFKLTLSKIERLGSSEALDPIVVVEILRSISWHAWSTDGETGPVARRIFESVPDSLDFRATLALIDGFGEISTKSLLQRTRMENELHEPTARNLLEKYPDGEQLRIFLERCLSHIRENYTGRSAPHVFCWRLIQSSISLARAIIENALEDPTSVTKPFAGAALIVILAKDNLEGIETARRLLQHDLNGAVAEAFGRYAAWGKETEEEFSIMRELLGTNEKQVARYVLEAVRHIAGENPQRAISLLKLTNIGASSDVADEILMHLQGNGGIPFELLSEDVVGRFLEQLKPLPALDGYWIQTFLANCSSRFAARTATFFMDRVSYAVTIEDWEYRPCNYGPYSDVALQFRKAMDFSPVFKAVRDWMRKGKTDNLMFLHFASELFAAMFQPFDDDLLMLISEWRDEATQIDVRILSEILKHAAPSLVFEHKSFVIRFLAVAKRFGQDILAEAIGSLWSSAITSSRIGTPGEPFQEDLLMKEKATSFLKEIPRFSPAFGLYESLCKFAQQNIERSRRERESFAE